MSAEIAIKFEGDAAFLNSVANPQPLANPSASSGGAQPNRLESASESAKMIADAIGGPVASVVNTISNTLSQIQAISKSLQGAIGFESPVSQVPSKILTRSGQDAATQTAIKAASTGASAAGTAATAETAAAATGAAEAGGSAAAGAGGSALLAGAVNPFTVAIAGAVVAVGLFAVAVKKTIDVLDAEAEKLADLTPALAQAKSIIELNRDLRMMRRGEELGPQLAKFMQQRDQIDARLTDIWTQVLRLLLTAWDTSRPFLEFTHDQLAQLNLRVAEISMGLVVIKEKILHPTATLEELPAIKDATKSLLDAITEDLNARNNEQFGGESSLEMQSQDLARKLIESWGSGRPPIPPSR